MNKKTLLYVLGGIAAVGIVGTAIYFATSGELLKGTANINPNLNIQDQSQMINVQQVTPEILQQGVSCSGSPNPALTGQTVTWTMAATGIQSLDTLVYYWQGQNLNTNQGKVVTAVYPAGTTQATVTPYVLIQTGPDKYENVFGPPCSVTLTNPAPVLPQVSCGPKAPSAGVGTDVTWEATWDQPGVVNVTYTWEGEGLTTGTGNPITTQYVTSGLKSAKVTVDFGANGKYTHNCENKVNVFDWPELSCAPAENSYKTGEEVTWNATFANVPYPANGTYEWSTGEKALGLLTVKKTYNTAGQQSMTVKTTTEVGPYEANCSVNIIAEAPQPQPPVVTPEPEPEVTPQEEPEIITPVVEETPVVQTPTPVEQTTSQQDEPSKCPGLNYPNDIKGHWAETFIRKSYDECLLKGYEDGTFRPDQPVTRAEAVKMVLVAGGIPPKIGCYDADCGSPFMDLDEWQGPWIRGAWDIQIVEGYSEEVFGPNRIISRAEATALVARAFNIAPHEGCYTANCGAGHPDNLFLDIADMWQGPWVRALWDKGWITGTGPNKFEPNRPMTRAELTKLIQTAKEK